MAGYSFSILTPDGEVYQGDVKSVVAPGKTGHIGILADHAPIISMIAPGSLEIITTEEQSVSFNVGGGVLEVRPDKKVVALLDFAKKPDTSERE